MKHAGASRIDVVLTYSPDTLALSITDDGCGFDECAAAFAGGAHFGLLDMKERAHLVGSRFIIRSQPGWGTAIEVEIPIDAMASADEQPETHANPGC